MHSYCDVWYTTKPDKYLYNEAPSYDDEEGCACCTHPLRDSAVECRGEWFCKPTCADDYFCQGD